MQPFRAVPFLVVAFYGVLALPASGADDAGLVAARKAPLTLYAPAAFPGALPAGRASNVKFTVLLAGGAAKSRPVVSLQIRGLGRNVRMRDDGRGPDLSAGDRIYSAVVRFDSEKAKAGRCYDARATARSATGQTVLSGVTRLCVTRFTVGIAASDLSEANIVRFSEGAATAPVVADEALIGVRSGLSDDRLQAIAASVDGRIVGSLNNLYQIRLRVRQTADGLMQVLAKLRSTGGVLMAAPNEVGALQTPPVVPLTPNDPRRPSQTNLDRVKAGQAWAITTGDPAMTIAVVDSGVDFDHPDFWSGSTPRFSTLAGNLVSADCTGAACVPLSTASTCHATSTCNAGMAAAVDTYGHGTLVAGVVAAATNNADGIAGATWQGHLLSVRSALTGSITAAKFSYGIDYATGQGARVISVSAVFSVLSVGSICPKVAEADATNGRLVVAAAGNGPDPITGTYTVTYYPAGCICTVGGIYPVACSDPAFSSQPTATPVANSSVNASDQDVIYDDTDGIGLDLSSNRAANVKLAAPGVGVISTARDGTACGGSCFSDYVSDPATPGYRAVTGTSFSTPLAAGMAALVLTRSPGSTNAQVRSTLFNTGVPLQAPVSGIRRIDALAALLTFNTAPTATNLSAPETYTEDVPLNLIDIVVSDVDGPALTATLTLSNPAAGALSTATSGAVTSTYVAGTGVWTASGALADVNVLLAGVVFNPAPNFNGNFTIATSVSDGVAPAITGSKAMTGTPVNDAPTATNLSAPETYTEDVALNLTDIVVSDVDSAAVTATLTLSNPLAGSLSTATSGAVTSTYVAGTGVWTASGALADVNVLLAGVVFTPAPNFNGNFTIATSVSDGVAPAITGSKAMTGIAVNDAPTGLPLISGIPTEDQTLTVVTGAIADADGLGPFSYQWLRGGVNIPGATGSTYVLGDADVGQLISVRVTYTDGGGTPESLTSAPTAAIVNVNDPPTGLPTISGTLTVGQTLTAITSAIADADGLGPFSYQWMRGVADIPGATGSTYVLVAADFGTVANVRVSYTDGHGTVETLTTVNATNTGDPHITTVDGLHYDFQAAGEFVTLRGANGMEIQTRQTPVSTAAPIADTNSGLSVGVSINTAVAARVGTHRVTLQPNISGLAAASGLELRVDGVLTTLPASGINFGSGARVVPLPGGAMQVDFPDGTTMVATPSFWTSNNVWYLNVSVFHTSASEGIMGARYQGGWLPRLGDGTALGARPAALHDRYVELYEKFANSWRVKKETSLFDYAPGTSTDTFTLASWPQENPPFVVPQGGKPAKPIDIKIARQQCRAVAGKNQNADCVFDVMVAGNRGFAKTYLLEQKIQGGLTATVLRDNRLTTKSNEPVTFTATVVKSAVLAGVVQRSVDGKSKPRGQVIPTGAVQFTLDGKNVGKPVRLDAKGQARLKMSRMRLGTRQLAARYLPTEGSVFLASRSLEEPRKVTKHKD